MSIIAIYDAADRAFAHRLIDKAKPGTRMQMLAPARTDDQSARMWAMLNEIADKYEHHGRYYDAEQWRVLFLHACGKEVDWAPSLDGGSTFIPFAGHTSRMDRSAMAEFLEFISCWASERGIPLKEKT